MAVERSPDLDNFTEEDLKAYREERALLKEFVEDGRYKLIIPALFKTIFKIDPEGFLLTRIDAALKRYVGLEELRNTIPERNAEISSGMGEIYNFVLDEILNLGYIEGRFQHPNYFLPSAQQVERIRLALSTESLSILDPRNLPALMGLAPRELSGLRLDFYDAQILKWRQRIDRARKSQDEIGFVSGRDSQSQVEILKRVLEELIKGRKELIEQLGNL